MATTLMILSGPSCVGKGPLLDALRRCHPELAYAKPVVHTSRSPRPGEEDGKQFHFRTAEQIRAYDQERFFVYEMRGQMRGIDLHEVAELLANNARVVLELHPPQVARFRAHRRVASATAKARVVAVLLQPLSVAEAEALAAAAGVAPAAAVSDVMLPKQIHRSLRMGKLLATGELADLRTRAEAAWPEMNNIDGFDHVLVNHDAEGDDHWLHTPPIGDAGLTLEAVARLLR